MRLIRIPLGTTLNDKHNFISEFIRVFPNNTSNSAESIWVRQTSVGVLQIILDVDTGTVIQVMRVNETGNTYWELSSRYLKSIPIIYDFNPNDNDPHNKIPLDNESTQSNHTISNDTKPQYNIDDILEIITEKGYKKLTDDQKTFLAKYSKK